MKVIKFIICIVLTLLFVVLLEKLYNLFISFFFVVHKKTEDELFGRNNGAANIDSREVIEIVHLGLI